MQAHLLDILSGLEPGTVFYAADLAADPTVDPGALRYTLNRLVRDGRLLRVARGLYCRPRLTPAGVALLPDQDSVIDAVIRHYHLEAMPMGLSAAWRLGLIPERPDPYQLAVTRGQYILRYNGWEVQFLPGRSMPFAYQTELAALLLTALPAIGEENLTPGHAATLKRLLVHSPERKAFREDVVHLPLWIKNYLRRL